MSPFMSYFGFLQEEDLETRTQETVVHFLNGRKKRKGNE